MSDREILKLFEDVESKLNDVSPLDEGLLSGYEKEEVIHQPDLKKAISKIEKKISKNENLTVDDVPAGEPLYKYLTEFTPSERSNDYKTSKLNEYHAAIDVIGVIYKNVLAHKTPAYQDLKQFLEGFINTLLDDRNILLNLSNLDAGDKDYLPHQALNSAIISMNIGVSLGFSLTQVIEIGCAAMLADVGMMQVPVHIKEKKEKLTKAEVFEIYKHPVHSYDLLLKSNDIPESVKVAVYQHHERINKSGYPKGRGSNVLHSYSKIIGLAGVYVALIAPRNYRLALKPYSAMKTVIQMSNQGIFDNHIVKAFLSYMSLFPIGSFIKLNSGKIGKVIKSNKGQYARPVVSVIFDGNDEILGEKGIFQIDLSKNEKEKISHPLGKPSFESSLMVGF